MDLRLVGSIERKTASVKTKKQQAKLFIFLETFSPSEPVLIFGEAKYHLYPLPDALGKTVGVYSAFHAHR